MEKSRKKKQSQKSSIKSPRLRSTKKLSAYTPTSKKRNSTKENLALVEGISMWPVLLPGYKVFYRSIDPNQIQLGNIAILHGEDRQGNAIHRVHRIIGRAGPLFLEAGDNTFTTTLVRAEQIIGVVTRAETWDGRPVALPKMTEKNLAMKFRFWNLAAQSFMLAHEMKDRLLRGKKSKVLWTASVLYRQGLAALGLKVPTIYPQ